MNVASRGMKSQRSILKLIQRKHLFKILNDEGYIRIKQAAAQQVNSVIQDNRVILELTVSATLEAVRRYPYNQELFIELITSQEPYQQSWMRLHGSQLLQLTENVHNEMTEKITKETISTVQDTQSESKKEV
jgi:hypothetical protein